MFRILLVEDDVEIHALVSRAIGTAARLRVVETLAAAILVLEEEPPDLVLLDVSLPDGDGFSLCSRMQSDERLRDVPIVFLTGRNAAHDRTHAFTLGADDWIEKPFDPHELRARIEGRLRKLAARSQSKQVVHRGRLRLHANLYRGFRLDADGEHDLGLTPHEFRILYHLAEHEGRVFSREQLLSAVWSHDVVVTERTVDTHVSNLRTKLGPERTCLEAVRSVGYRFVARPSST
jgi:DNA-binding response OmpR family regulator